jgi:hypothetical protein
MSKPTPSNTLSYMDYISDCLIAFCLLNGRDASYIYVCHPITAIRFTHCDTQQDPLKAVEASMGRAKVKEI